MNEITPEMAYLTGFIIGDGNLSLDYRVRVVEEDENYIKIYSQLFEKVFGKKSTITFDKYNNSFVAYVCSKKIWSFFVDELGIPKGTKSRIVRIPEKIMNGNNDLKAAVLSGLFDAESSVIIMKDKIHHPRGYLKIQLKVYNLGLANDIFKLLSELNLKPRIYNYNEFSMVNLHGKMQGRMFLEKIGYRHPRKDEKLRRFL